MKLQTESKELGKELGKEIGETLFKKINMDNSFDWNVRSLQQGCSRQDLKQFYAFLLAAKEEDERVTSLNLSGLRKMVVFRLTQLMPQACVPCKGKTFYYGREEQAVVSCRRCQKTACRTCYPMEEISKVDELQRKGWRYMCKECDEEVERHTGLERLNQEDFRKDAKKIAKAGASLEELVAPSTSGEKKDEVEAVVDDDGDNSEEEDLEDDTIFGEKASQVQEKAKKPKEKKEVGTKTKSDDEKKKMNCPHLKKGRCFFGLSGKKQHEGKSECPYLHRRVCERLLKHGDRGDRGCKRGNECPKLHVKMCPHSLQGVCMVHGCTAGLHVSGTNTREARTREEEKKKRGEEERWRGEERRGGERERGGEERRGGAGSGRGGQMPSLPPTGRPDQLRRVLGRQSHIKCEVCPKVFSTNEELRHHVEAVHRLPCNVCGVVLRHSVELENHMRDAHSRREQTPNQDTSAAFLGELLGEMRELVKLLRPGQQEQATATQAPTLAQMLRSLAGSQ